MLVTISGAPHRARAQAAHHIAKADKRCAGEDPTVLPTLSQREKMQEAAAGRSA